jgi:cyclopropane fatty-acyl-phospholipid synthase-like methyltransferase
MEAPVNAIQYIRSHVADESSILELGCGRGSLVRGLREAGCMSHYCGVDISRYAIEHARAHGDHRSSWAVSDIESFRSPFQWDAIVLIESIYYVRPELMAEVFERFAEMLTEDGFILIRVHDAEQHADCLSAIREIVPGAQRIDPTLLAIYRPALAAAL